MPLGDGTGPGGIGPMTGRAAGYCAGYTVPGYMNHVSGFRYPRNGAYTGANLPYYGTLPYRMPGYTGFYTATAPPWGRGRGRFYGYQLCFGRGFNRGRGRW